MPFFYLAIAILAEVSGTTALKLSDGFTRLGPSAVTVIGYGISFYFLALCLRSLSVGFAYAVWAGAGIALITLVGVFAFGERLDAAGIAGLALIVAGIVVLKGFSGISGA
ncbi:MAG: multidrug efflux SMR transporter [Rhodospirillales bacterium]|nr:multidrug efflux SMR transporter [Rhodospirillales bacterium]